MSLCKQKFLMFTPAVTREYTPGFRRISRKTMRLPPRREMRPDSPALGAEKFPVSNETHRSLDLLVRTQESPPVHTHTCRSRLMSLQECDIAWCSPNQLEITADSPELAPEQFPVPHHTGQVA